MKHTKSIRNIHTDNMQEFEPIYYFCSIKDGGMMMVRNMSILHHVHAYIEDDDMFR